MFARVLTPAVARSARTVHRELTTRHAYAPTILLHSFSSSAGASPQREAVNKYSWATTEMPPPSPGRGIIGRSANFDVNERKEQFERWSWLLKLVGYMNEDDRLFTDSNRVLQSCVNQSAIRDFYRALQLVPSFRGQQALLMAHVWMVHRRLSQEGEDGKVMQELMFDRLWEETVVRIRFMNVSELTVNKHLAEVQQICFNACIAYDRAMKDGQGALQAAIAKHLLDDETPAKQRIAAKLAEYVKCEVKHLEKVDAKYIMNGTIPWGPVLEPASGTPVENTQELVLIGEKVGNWRAALDNRGKLYYWNLSTRFSVWDKPTGDDLFKGLNQDK